MLRRSRCKLHGCLAFGLGAGKVRVGHELFPLIPSNNQYYDPPKLRAKLDTEGYLYFKKVVPRELITLAFSDVANQMLENKWVLPEDRDAEEKKNGFSVGCPYPSPILKGEMKELPPVTTGVGITTNVASAISGVSVMAVLRQVFGGPVQSLPLHTLELSYPGEQHSFHSDSILTCRGSKLIITAWVPLQDVTLSHGGMVVVRGSNSHSNYRAIRKTYGSYDIEEGNVYGDGGFSNDPAEMERIGRGALHHVQDVRSASPVPGGETDTAEFRTEEEQRLERQQEMKEAREEEELFFQANNDFSNMPCFNPMLGSSFEAGDVVLTTIYTMHSFLTNQTHSWRLSAESKWIMEGDDVGADPRYTGEHPVGLQKWMSERDTNRTKYHRSMEQAKKDWGIIVPKKF